MEKFKVTFSLDESDANYFRSLYRKAQRGAKELDPAAIIRDARAIVKEVRASKKTPGFVLESIEVLADLVDLIQDEEFIEDEFRHELWGYRKFRKTRETS